MSSNPSATETLGASGNSMPGTTAPTVQVQPYLFFNGNCDKALEFYQRTLGAEVTMLMRFKDSPEGATCGPDGPVNGDNVMHASFRIGETTLMASDGCEEKVSFQGFSLSLSLPEQAEAERIFAALADGGTVQQPLIKTFFASRFGMVMDRFGVSWMVVVMP